MSKYRLEVGVSQFQFVPKFQVEWDLNWTANHCLRHTK